jgi:hypothetical protein
MTNMFQALAATALLSAAALPAFATTDMIDVNTLTCGSYMAMTSGDRIMAANAVVNYANDAANAANTAELQVAVADQTVPVRPAEEQLSRPPA